MGLLIKFGLSKFIIDDEDNFIIKNSKDEIRLKMPLDKVTLLFFKTGLLSNKSIVLAVQGHMNTIQIGCNYGEKREREEFFRYMLGKTEFLNLSYSQAVKYKQYESYRACMRHRESLRREGWILKDNIIDKITKGVKGRTVGDFSFQKKDKNMSFKNFVKLNQKNISDPGIIDHLYNVAIKAVFIESDLYSKLEDFIINNTKKFDNAEMDEEEYDRQLKLFMYYLSKINSDSMMIKTNITRETLEEIADKETIDMVEEFGDI